MSGINRRGTEPRHIQQRRTEADRLVDAKSVMRQDFALAHKAKWTHRTEAMIDRNAVKTITRTMREADDAALNARRQKLAALFQREEQAYKAEIDSLTESSADRAKRMIVYARQRKEEREQKRQQFADERLKAQYREGCDDLRTIGSQIAEKQTAAEVGRQLVDNARRKKEADAENARYDALWEAQRQLKNKQADDEEKKKQNFANHIKQALTDQVAEARQRKIDDARKAEEEKIAFQMRLDADDAAAKQRQAAEAEQKRREKANLAVENAAFLAERLAQKQAERDAERAMVEKVLNAHRQETHQKLVDKRQMRMERLEYMEFLRMRRDEEKKLERELDRLTQIALDRDNQKRDLVMLKEELARAELAKQVQQARHDQLIDKKGQAVRTAKELSLEKNLMERELTLWRQRQAHEAEEERLKAAQRKLELERQIEANQARRDILYAKSEQEHLDSKRAEAEYAAFVAAERADPQKLLKRANFRRKKDGYTFSAFG